MRTFFPMGTVCIHLSHWKSKNLNKKLFAFLRIVNVIQLRFSCNPQDPNIITIKTLFQRKEMICWWGTGEINRKCLYKTYPNCVILEMRSFKFDAVLVTKRLHETNLLQHILPFLSLFASYMHYALGLGH